MPGKCSFQDQWFKMPCAIEGNWTSWLRPVEKSQYKAYCTICRSEFGISHGGVFCVKVHEKGKKHVQKLLEISKGKQTLLQFSKKNDAPSVLATGTSPMNTEAQNDCSSGTTNSDTKRTECAGTSGIGLGNFILKDDVAKAEIVWALNKVVTHGSSRGSGSSSELFPYMFPDSLIAKNFMMQKDKLSYVITYGLGPYFQSKLVDEVKNANFFAISLDESLNKISQKGQMDLIVRFWDEDCNAVVTKYLTSTFLQRATAKDLLETFTTTMANLGLPLNHILQVSVDGPNVNLKFLRDLQDSIGNELDGNGKLFDTGTCPLHVVQGAYKTAHTTVGWKIHEFLRSLYYLFRDFPVRRAEYTLKTASEVFPLKFCQVRWVENSRVLQRAIEMFPSLVKYVSAVEKNPPNSQCYVRVKEALKDKLLFAKLEFLLSVSLQLEPFLTKFQSNDALFPLLYQDTLSLLIGIGTRILKKNVVEDIKSGVQLTNVDVYNSDVLKAVSNIDIGFGAKAACKDLKEVVVLLFRNECRCYLQHIFSKLTVKSPLKSKIVKGASCLSPEVIRSSLLRNSRITTALDIFVSNGHIAPHVADCIKRDYLIVCDNAAVKDAIETYDWRSQKLDALVLELISMAKVDNAALIQFCKKILVMFHGNAAVERGFSVNRECLVENLSEASLIAQRCVYDSVHSEGGVKNVQITKQMIHSVRNASARRQEALRMKNMKKDEEVEAKRKAKSELKELQATKRRMLEMHKEEMTSMEDRITFLKTQA